jgi:hypothetical protein
VHYQLAQLNIALAREPLGAPLLRDFMAALDPVNAAADASPGFVWRLQTEEGDATGIRGFGSDRMIVNLSVWESLEALRAFAYGQRDHLAVVRRRREWFERLGEAFLVLWWVPAGHVPTVAEAEERLDALRAEGPTPYAFTFRRAFAPPGGDGAPRVDDGELCPAG